MGCYMILFCQKNPEEAWSYFANVEPPFKPFIHATNGESNYHCTILDCLRGLFFGVQLKWYDFSTFNCKEYLEYERVENGDMNWIVPGKFLAFSSPSPSKYDSDGVFN